MNKLTLILLTLLSAHFAFGQQEPLFSQYRTNGFVINPAVAGSNDAQELRFAFRSQWRQFPGAPRTAVVSWQGAMDEKSGTGIMAFSDAVGPSQRNGFQLAYAFHIPLGYEGNNGQTKLSLGMAGKFMQFRFRADRVYFQDNADPAIFEANSGLTIGDVAFGAYLYNDNLFAGFSAPNLLQSSFGTTLDQDSRTLISKLYRHYFAFFGYRFRYDQFSVEPSVLIKKVETTPYQIEGNVKFYLMDDKFFAGMSYRTDWLMTFMVGVKAKKLQFVYSSDFMLPNAAPGLSYGASNEFTIGYDIGGGNTKPASGGNWKQLYREE